MTTVSQPVPAREALDHLHDVLVVVLISLRALCWDGEPGQTVDLLWQAAAAGAFLLVALERGIGLRPSWRWSGGGVLAVVLLLVLLPTALAAPAPAPAWCRWSGWAACLGAAAYLAQVLPGRARLAIAALLAALATEVVLTLVQRGWGLPAMAAAQAAGGGGFSAIAAGSGDIAERIANGGAFATFTLSNQLAAWLALVLPVAAGCAWATRGPGRWLGVALVAAGLAALAATGAKGAWLCLAIGAAVGWWLAVPGRWRWLPLPFAIAGVVAVVATGAAAASIDVRLGYWRSAVALIGQAPFTGHGLDAFGSIQQRVMLPGDEPTLYVHNEVLEAALAGGVVVGIVLLASLIVLAWPRRSVAPPLAEERQVHPLVWWLPALLIPYIAVYGALDGNLSWWPGGDMLVQAGGLALPLARWGWAVVLGLAAAAVCVAARRLSAPPAWAWTTGLAAVALSAGIDFNLHAAGIVGTALFVACLAPGAGWEATGAVSRILPLLAATALAAVVGVGMMTGSRLAEAGDLLAATRQMRSDPAMVEAIAAQVGLPPGAPPAQVASAAAARIWDLAEGDPRTLLGALEFLPATTEITSLAEGLARAAPDSAAVRLHLARRLAAGRRWSEAVEAAEAAAGLSPTSPRVLGDAAAILAEADPRLPAAGLAARATAMRAEAARLQPLVHPQMRASTRAP